MMMNREGGQGTIVYLDVLIFENCLMDYCLLAAAAALGGFSVKRWRMVLGAVLGGLYAGAQLIWSATPLGWIPVQILFGFGMIGVAYGAEHFWKKSGLFFVVSCATAGITLLLSELRGAVVWKNGIYQMNVPLRWVLLAGAAGWAISGLLLGGKAKHGILQQDTEEILITFLEKTERIQVLEDIGNELCDPMTGLPIIIIERDAAKRILPRELAFFCDQLSIENPAELLPRIPSGIRNRFRLVPFSSVGRRNGLLAAFRPDTVTRNGKKENLLIAISPTPISNGRYEGLIGAGKR